MALELQGRHGFGWRDPRVAAAGKATLGIDIREKLRGPSNLTIILTGMIDTV